MLKPKTPGATPGPNACDGRQMNRYAALKERLQAGRRANGGASAATEAAGHGSEEREEGAPRAWGGDEGEVEHGQELEVVLATCPGCR